MMAHLGPVNLPRQSFTKQASRGKAPSLRFITFRVKQVLADEPAAAGSWHRMEGLRALADDLWRLHEAETRNMMFPDHERAQPMNEA